MFLTSKQAVEFSGVLNSIDEEEVKSVVNPYK